MRATHITPALLPLPSLVNPPEVNSPAPLPCLQKFPRGAVHATVLSFMLASPMATSRITARHGEWEKKRCKVFPFPSSLFSACGPWLTGEGRGCLQPSAEAGACLLTQVRSPFKSAGPMGTAPLKRPAVGPRPLETRLHTRLALLAETAARLSQARRGGSNRWLIRGVLPWSPAMSAGSRSAPAGLNRWELPSTSAPSVSGEPLGFSWCQGCTRCRGAVAVTLGGTARGAAAAHGRSPRGCRNGRRCSPKALTLSSPLTSASLSCNNAWLDQAGMAGSVLKPGCSRRPGAEYPGRLC